MRQSSLVGVERAAPEPKGRDTATLGPSDSSDSGSDMAGLDTPEIADPALPVDVALLDEFTHCLPGYESLGGSASDAAGTGERRSAGSDPGALDAPDIAVERVFVPVEPGEDLDPPDDEDPDLAFIDDIQAEDLPAQEDGEEGDEDEADGDGRALRGGPVSLRE